jgi:hypothetical protein
MADMEDYMLTTVDNPINPFTSFNEWYHRDLALGHNTMGLLARVAAVPSNLSEMDRDNAINQAIEEIARENVTGVHRRVTQKDFENSIAI